MKFEKWYRLNLLIQVAILLLATTNMFILVWFDISPTVVYSEKINDSSSGWHTVYENESNDVVVCNDNYHGVCLDNLSDSCKDHVKNLIDRGWDVSVTPKIIWGNVTITDVVIAYYMGGK